MRSYIPVLLLILIAVTLPVIIWSISAILRPHFPSIAKSSAYECGIKAKTEARERFSVRYYLIAVMFLVFDVEIVFLMPWATQMRELSTFGLIEISIFIFLLLFGYGYIWSRGVLTWE